MLRSFVVRPYYCILSLMKGAWHLTQIRVCPQVPQSYIFLTFWNKVELIQRNLSPWGMFSFVLMGCVQRYLSPLMPPSFLDLVVNSARRKEVFHNYSAEIRWLHLCKPHVHKHNSQTQTTHTHTHRFWTTKTKTKTNKQTKSRTLFSLKGQFAYQTKSCWNTHFYSPGIEKETV